MAAKFAKKSTPTRMIYPSGIYPDLYDNNKTTTNIQTGTVSGIMNTSVVIGDIEVPSTPSFGDAKLVGGKIGLYINSITLGQNSPGIPGLKAFKVTTAIGNREGGKSSAGSLVSLEGFAQFAAMHTGQGVTEDFSGYVAPNPDEEQEVVQDVIIKRYNPYLSRSDGYKYGERFGQKRNVLTPVSSSKHFERYGETHDELGEIYFIEHEDNAILTGGAWYSVKEHKSLLNYNREKWKSKNLGQVKPDASRAPEAHRMQRIKWSKTETFPRTNIEEVQRVNTTNTFFDGVKEATTFKTQDENGTIVRAAYGDVAFSSSKVKSGGQSLHMHSVYPHRDNVIASIFYPKGQNAGSGEGVIDKSENNQCSFVTKQLPLPTHLYSGKGSATAPPQPMMPTVSLCLNIENLAPALRRDQTTAGLPNHDRRLNRSLCITFGEEKPGAGDNFYSYVKRHAPNFESQGQDSSNGNGSSAKSFFGMALVNSNGKIGMHKLSSQGKVDSGGTSYTDISFRGDATRGEVAFVTAPNTSFRKELSNQWMDLEFQFHPDLNGVYFLLKDPDTGDVFSDPNPHTAAHLINIKNITASGDGLWALNDSTNFPRYMTIWLNNYQAIKGAFSDAVQKYSTGLKTGAATAGGTDATDTELKVYASRGGDDATRINQGGLSVKHSSYIVVGSGDSISDEDGLTSVISARDDDTNTAGFLTYTCTDGPSSSASANKELFFDKDPDREVTSSETMESSVYIDNINISQFNMLHNNATPSGNNRVPSRLKIPKTYQSSPSGFVLTSNIENINDAKVDQPSYLCFGFDNLSDLEGSAKKMLMNGFSVSGDNEPIYLGVHSGSEAQLDSDSNCLRVGYTSSVEDYGRQGAADSNSKTDSTTGPDEINNESAVFSNKEGSPTTSFRGLNVGDLGVDNAEFSVVSEDTGNVDGFTQKGFIQWNFNRRRTNSNETLASAVNDATTTSITVSDGSAFSVNGFIQTREGTANNRETMLVTAINSNTLTVVRAQNDPDGGALGKTHASGTALHHIAMPEKRESIFVSARPLKATSTVSLTVDDASIFNSPLETEYIVYIYNDSHANPTTGYPRTIKLIKREGDEVTFDREHGIPAEGEYKFLISPKKYWLMLEIHNFAHSHLRNHHNNSAHTPYSVITSSGKFTDEVIDDSETRININNNSGGVFRFGYVIQIEEELMLIVSEPGTGATELTVQRGYGSSTATTHPTNTLIQFPPRKYLPEKTYTSAIMVNETGNLGATFNETLYNDGDYINSWDLDPFVKQDDTAIDLKDYGFGDFKEEKKSGGHLGHLNLNVQNDVSKYKEIDVSGIVKVDNVKPEETFTTMISPDNPTESYKINIDTETSTNNPIYFIAEFEDELPKITNFKVQPNEKDPFLVDYIWTCADEDVWYGFLQISDNLLSHQYDGAILHLPLNDEGVDGEKVDHSADNVISAFDAEGAASSFDTSIDSAASAPSYDVEGLAGNALRFSGNTTLLVGTEDTNAGNTFSDITKEMSIVIHATHDTGNFSGGGSGSTEHLLVKRRDDGLKKSVEIFASYSGSGSTGHIMARVYSSDLTRVELRSSSPIPKGVPMNIMLTFDANLTSQNIKLFINGKLEDVTGPVIAAHSSSETNTGWVLGTNLNTGQGRLRIGSDVVSLTADGWDGKIEEVAIYDRVLYPVDVTSGKFTLTKPLKDLTSDVPVTETKGISNTYNAKLFVKDYHNIRGRGKEDVACSPTASHRKAAFEVQGVLD